jgi:hypothetical protein
MLVTFIKKERLSMIVYATAFYPCLFEPNTMSGKYQMNLGQLDHEAVTNLQGAGMAIRTGEGKKEDHGEFITAKSGHPINVVDAAGNPWDEDRLIGNGSKVKVSVNPYEWTYKRKSGVSAGLNSVMVLEWKEYNPNETLEPELKYIKDELE